MREFGIGQSLPRVEDDVLLRGLGRYTDDIVLPRQAHMFVLRSPHPAAHIRSIDVTAAVASPGILAVLSGRDAMNDGLGSLPSSVKRKRPDGRPNPEPPYPVLVVDQVRYVGDAVAVVIGETIAQARDAAEMIDVAYDPLPAVTATDAATKPGAPAVWADAPDNVCFLFEIGDKAAVELGFARAAHVIRLDFTITRVSANPMEPRNAIGLYDPTEGRYTLYAGMQGAHGFRTNLVQHVFKIPETRLRVVAPHCGGAFGMKQETLREPALVLWAARRVGRPVRWQSDRSEGLLSDYHARDNLSTAELALDRDGRFLALRVRTTANLGAYLAPNGLHSPTNNLGGLAGTYTTPAIHAAVTGVFTHTAPTAPYRGAGRPEASYAIERVIDTAARQLGIDPAELRRRNMIPSAAMPFKTGLVFTYDSGEFEKNMDRVLAMAGWTGFAERRVRARAQGRLRGIGMASVIEIAGGPPALPLPEHAQVRFAADGSATVLLGVHSQGQGHETTFRQLAVDLLGLPPERVRIVQGDTDLVSHGFGTFGSRSISAGGAALTRAAEKIVDKARQIAAHVLETSARDIEFADGRFTVAGTDRTIGLDEVARISFDTSRLPRGFELGLDEGATISPAGPTFPNGCHVCEVEIDPETGVTRVVGYWVVDDVGRVVNPLIVKGQLHGGIAQGLGQALFETVVYERAGGQLLSGSFMDYAMPRADDVPAIATATNEVLTSSNPLGIKGAGEAGNVGSLPAVMNAVNDALAPLGIGPIDMPATPERVWRAIRRR
jgi:carbon-monoxide dehydrogenase large subunit